jgi:hypothetical protein
MGIVFPTLPAADEWADTLVQQMKDMDDAYSCEVLGGGIGIKTLFDRLFQIGVPSADLQHVHLVMHPALQPQFERLPLMRSLSIYPPTDPAPLNHARRLFLVTQVDRRAEHGEISYRTVGPWDFEDRPHELSAGAPLLVRLPLRMLLSQAKALVRATDSVRWTSNHRSPAQFLSAIAMTEELLNPYVDTVGNVRFDSTRPRSPDYVILWATQYRQWCDLHGIDAFAGVPNLSPDLFAYRCRHCGDRVNVRPVSAPACPLKPGSCEYHATLAGPDELNTGNAHAI